ncbi:hypothetical protein FA13DRAFT_362989 [Coprinellus micaceus]|uniref:Uncharacterized protein n=1 Tax=Coprinellus micaceus TaxID=71717 RepID=A0A4Y7TBJ3_COPMI|nr:hypothetical protein FA13DRAFT_362989 [Coprinellus micaceus]
MILGIGEKPTETLNTSISISGLQIQKLGVGLLPLRAYHRLSTTGRITITSRFVTWSTVHFRLPDDWKSLYERCITGHGSFSEQEQEEHWSAMVTFKAHIEEAKHELGLDVRNKDGSDLGQGECPVHGGQASDEEHADLFQQQHEVDGEELARSLVGPSAHHASGFIPARLGAHEHKFQERSVPASCSWPSTVEESSISYHNPEPVDATVWMALLDARPPPVTPPASELTPPTPPPEILEAIHSRAARSGIQLSLWVNGVDSQWGMPR